MVTLISLNCEETHVTKQWCFASVLKLTECSEMNSSVCVSLSPTLRALQPANRNEPGVICDMCSFLQPEEAAVILLVLYVCNKATGLRLCSFYEKCDKNLLLNLEKKQHFFIF